MNTKTLVKKLKAVDVVIDPKTLTNWGRGGIVSGCKISAATRRQSGRPPKRLEETDHRGKPGRFHADWDDEAIEEVAAVWAVSGGRKRISRAQIEMIKTVANHAYQYASAFYEFPPGIRVTGPEPTSQWNWRVLKMMVYPDHTLNAQAQKWIATKEKAKRNKKISEPKKIVFCWRSRLSAIRAYPIVQTGQELLDRLKRTLPRVDGVEPNASSIELPVWFPQDQMRMLRSPDDPRGWKLRPARWSFDLERIELEETELEHDELVYLLDGRDSRIKAFYAPYDAYDPSVDYEKRASAPDQNDESGTGALRDAGIDWLINDCRLLINEIGPIIAASDRERINSRIISSVLALAPATHMHLIRWSAPPLF